MSWQLREYLDSRGKNVVEDFISGLTEVDQALVRAGIAFIAQVGNRAREPHSKSIGDGLFEIRVKSHRIFYCFRPGRIVVLLHGFTKKTRKTPDKELETGYKRMKEMENEN